MQRAPPMRRHRAKVAPKVTEGASVCKNRKEFASSLSICRRLLHRLRRSPLSEGALCRAKPRRHRAKVAPKVAEGASVCKNRKEFASSLSICRRLLHRLRRSPLSEGALCRAKPRRHRRARRKSRQGFFLKRSARRSELKEKSMILTRNEHATAPGKRAVREVGPYGMDGMKSIAKTARGCGGNRQCPTMYP